MDENRVTARGLAKEYLEKNDPTGWFEKLYSSAKKDANVIPWADLVPNPNLVEWLNKNKVIGNNRKAIKVGCGLSDDAEELASRGFTVTAFDISNTAINWCRERFPKSKVNYLAQDLLDMPSCWNNVFDFVIESYTLQVLPSDLRGKAVEKISNLVATGGILLVICRARDENDEKGKMPWPVTKNELAAFENYGLKIESFEDYVDNETPPVRRFRVVYKK
jgi:hypothetical protein